MPRVSRKAVEDLVAEARGGLTTTEIARTLNAPSSSVTSALLALWHQGRIQRANATRRDEVTGRPAAVYYPLGVKIRRSQERQPAKVRQSAEAKRIRARILERLGKAENGMIARDIAAAVGLTTAQAALYLAGMRNVGKVYAVDQGGKAGVLWFADGERAIEWPTLVVCRDPEAVWARLAREGVRLA